MHTHQVPGTGSPAPSPLPRGWQRAAGGSGAAGWARLRFFPQATGLPSPPARGPPLPPAGSSPRSPASSALADWAHSDSESPHLQKVMRTFTLAVCHLLSLNVTAFKTLTKRKETSSPEPKEQRNGRPKFVRTSYVGGFKGLLTEVLSLDHVSDGSFFLRNQKWFRGNCTRMTKATTKSSNRIGWTNNHQTVQQSCGQIQEKIIFPVSNFLQYHKSTAAFRRH